MQQTPIQLLTLSCLCNNKIIMNLLYLDYISIKKVIIMFLIYFISYRYCDYTDNQNQTFILS